MSTCPNFKELLISIEETNEDKCYVKVEDEESNSMKSVWCIAEVTIL